MEETLLIPLALANRVIDYLARRPFGEVYELIPPLTQLSPVEEPSEPEAVAEA